MFSIFFVRNGNENDLVNFIDAKALTSNRERSEEELFLQPRSATPHTFVENFQPKQFELRCNFKSERP